MVRASSAAEFGALGLEVTGVRVEAGEVVVGVQAPGGRRPAWGVCGRGARSKGRREVVLRDAPSGGGRPRWVVWNKRIWACPDEGCAQKSWTERGGLAAPRGVLTVRAVRWAVDRLGAVEGSVASSARRLGVGWATVWSAVEASAGEVAAGPRRVGPVAKLGFDETVMASATRRRRRRFVTAAVDAGTGQVIDVFDGRDAVDLRQWLQAA